MDFVMPAKVYAPLYSRYEAGMNYGYHVDGAVMGGLGSLQRTDFAMTVFLRPPATYDGGELVVMQDSGPVEIKLDAGEAFVYPASTLHKVNPVTRGVRLAVVTWMQSLIRHSELREVLYDLRRATDLATKAGEKDLLHLLIKAEQNLIRYGADV